MILRPSVFSATIIRPNITRFELGDSSEGNSLGRSKVPLQVGDVRQKKPVMNAVKTVGLSMWRVGMIAWKSRSEKRFTRLIRSVDGFLIRLFGLA